MKRLKIKLLFLNMLILLISNCLNGKLLSEKTYKAYKEKNLMTFIKILT